MKRKIYNKLIEWKNTDINTPLMIIGARQIGKTYIIKKFCQEEFKKNIYINLLEHPEIIKIFEQEINIEEKFNRFQLYLNENIDLNKTIIFFDEIQESEQLISALKYFCESEKPYKIICAGSLLGVKLNRFHSSFPVGKVRILHMQPMDFEEFLLANTNEKMIEEIRKCYNEMKPIDNVLHERLLNFYRLYLCTGGMPAAVKDIINKKQNILKFKKEIIEDIIYSYLNDMNKYVITNNEAIKIEAIYKSIPIQLGNVSNKFQYGKVEKGARARDYETAIDWLLSSNMVYKCNLLNKIEIPPKAFIKENFFKLYLSDVGLLVALLEIKHNEIMLDKSFIYKGIIAENYVANQLIAKNYSLYYWESNNKAEVDFAIYNDDGIIPIEVKAKDKTMSKSLNIYMNRYEPKYGIKISTKNFGFENNIKSIPLYAVFCL